MQILEQNEPSQAQGLLGIGLGRDETEQRPSLLGRTETETKHLVAPRDQAEPRYLTPEARPSRGSARLAQLVCRPGLFDKHRVTIATDGYHSNLDWVKDFYEPQSSFKLEYSLQILKNSCNNH